MLSVSKRILVIAGTFATGLAVGILAIFAFQSMRPQKEHSPQDGAQGEIEQTSTKSANSLLSTSSGGVGQFEEIFDRDSISDQHSALHTTLSQATEQELKRWWTESKKIARDSHRKIAQQVILRNLTAKNPQEALRHINEVSIFQTDEALTTVFGEWAVLHLEGAIEAASTMVSSQRNVALQAILETRDDHPEDKLRSIARQLESEDTFLKWVSDTKVSKNIETPEESWEILLKDDVDDALQMETLVIVATTLYEQVGFKVLSKIYSEIEDYTSQRHLLRIIAQKNPIGALDYTRGLAADYDKLNLSTIIVRDWAKTNAQAAMEAISTLESSSFSSTLEDVVVTTWARTTPIKVIENIESISEQYRLSTLETAFATLAREDPMNALTTLSSVESYVGNTSSIQKKIVAEWSYLDPNAAADWVVNNFSDDDSQRRALLIEVLPRLVHLDPDEAFALAIAQPTINEGVNLDYLVIRELASTGNVDTVKKLLPHVKENSRAAVYGTVGELMVRESQTEEALELGEDLTQEQRSYYHVRVLSLWATINPKNLYESLENLPTSSIKSRAAMILIVGNRKQPLLTDDQIEQARTLLNSDDEATVKRIENR